MEKPKFTIVYNSKTEDGFVGVCWEFYTDEKKAQARYDELSSYPEKYSATIRPYYHDTDRHHLGAGHWELKNHSEKWNKLNTELNNALDNIDEWKPKKRDTETPMAKLRNQLSPYYSLPDIILALDEKPEIKSILMEQAKIAKSTNERIKELLVEIEGTNECEKDFEDNRDTLDKFLSPENSQIEIAIRTSIVMHDYDNWDNGTYKGKMGEVVPHVLEHIKKHVIEFAEYLHKHYPNVIKPKNYLEVPIPKGERKWMRAFFSDDIDEKTAEKIYDEFLEYVKNKKI